MKKKHDETPKPTQPSKLKSFFRDERTTFTIGTLLLLFTIYLFFAMLSFLFTASTDVSLIDSPDSTGASFANWTGKWGAIIAAALINKAFGVSSFVLLLLPLVIGLRLFHVKVMPLLKMFVVVALILVWGSVTLRLCCYTFYKDWAVSLGGAHGDTMHEWLFRMTGWGEIAVLAMLILITLLISWHGFIPWVKRTFKRKPKQYKAIAPDYLYESNNDGTHRVFYVDANGDEINDNEAEACTFENGICTKCGYTVIKPIEKPIKEEEPEEIKVEVEKKEKEEDEELDVIVGGKDEDDVLPDDIADSLVKRQGLYNPRLDLSYYKFPSIDLLRTYPNETKPVVDEEEQKANVERIVKTLRDYKIEVENVSAIVGPTVTLYEIVLKAGTKVATVKNLEDDIMMSLAAKGIRIIAPIPGKTAIGIEVPNAKPQIVSMHSVIASKKFQEEVKMELPVALGRTITNEVFTFDLSKTPHLLVAGATGQGKSVGLNAIITSLLYKKHPTELKMVLVDPKQVEFSLYTDLCRHYMAEYEEQGEPIITDMDKVVKVLNSLVQEMEDRYTLLKSAKCRNIVEYNDKFVHRKLNPAKGHRFLPYIVIVIDEYGDFIMQKGKEVETPIARITQKARAVGMHMILATQRPSVNVVTGVIKANVPGRVAFRVASLVDSRTILDASGAQRLIGKGDLLYQGGSETIRMQCAFVDTPEVEQIVSYIGKQTGFLHPYMLPEPKADSMESADDGIVARGGFDMGQKDPLFDEAARMVVTSQQGSTSNIQRRFAIGYNRAGKIIDQLEKAGIVGPQEGSKPRQVLVGTEDELNRILDGQV